MNATSEAERIDAVIRSYSWMDFELECGSRWVAVVVGAIDPSSQPDLRITFRDVAVITLPTEWKTDTSAVAFREVAASDAFEINTRYGVEHGYTLFEFVPEDLSCRCVVAARSVELTELKKGETAG